MQITEFSPQIVASIRKSMMVLGFILFLAITIITASLTGTPEMARSTGNPQPELQAIAHIRK